MFGIVGFSCEVELTDLSACALDPLHRTSKPRQPLDPSTSTSLSVTSGSYCSHTQKITPQCLYSIPLIVAFKELNEIHRCTTELGAFAKLEPEFTKRGVKLIGLSANTVESHGGWVKDIDEISGSHLKFPIIGDKVDALF